MGAWVRWDVINPSVNALRSGFAKNDIEADKSSAKPLEESLGRTVKGGRMAGHRQGPR